MYSSRMLLTLSVATLATAIPMPSFGQELRPECEPQIEMSIPTIERAVSLKRMEAELQNCGADKTCAAEAKGLYGLTIIDGYVVDEANEDVLLLGRSTPGAPALVLDDFVLTLRSTMHHFLTKDGDTLLYSPIAVSIDPDPQVHAHLEYIMDQVNKSNHQDAMDHAYPVWCETCEHPQQVRVLGVPASYSSDGGGRLLVPHMSDRMVAADYFMKEISNSMAKIANPDFQSLQDLALEAAVSQFENPTAEPVPVSVMSRFWFTAGRHTYKDDEGIVIIERADVRLLDEEEHLTSKGIVATGQVNELARQFSCNFSRLFPELAENFGIYQELAGHYRWLAISELLVDRNVFAEASYVPSFLIDEFEIEMVEIPATLPGVPAMGRWDYEETSGQVTRTANIRLPSCGGAELVIDAANVSITDDRSGTLQSLSHNAIDSRPTSRIAHWYVDS